MNALQASLIGLTLIATGASAKADDLKIGFQATLSKPQGDLGNSDWMDGKMGYGVGVHALIDLQNGHAIVPRLDYTMYKRSLTESGIDFDIKSNILTIGADYNYYVGGKANEGFYVTAGLGYANGEFKIDNAFLPISATKGTLYLAAGAGYMFTPNIGAELRYQSAKFTDVETTVLGETVKGDVSAPSINASLVVRF